MRRRAWVGAWDRALMARVATTESAVLDRVLPGLGRAANHGLLWLGVSGALGATGNRSARRAALRGLIALSLGSAAVNVVSKQLVGRTRPDPALIPLARRLVRAPLTTSFPSGHSASAAAFAAGVALENPLLGVPVAVAGAAVAASRVYTGAHYPSDVLAGMSLGVGAALLTLWWWPRTPPGPSEAVSPSRPVPASKTGTGVVIVLNSGAGSARDSVAEALARELPDAELVTAGEGDDLPGLVAAAAERAAVLGIAGGDGTVNLGASVAAARGLPLLVVPAGTLNHFARDLGVNSVADAVAALRAGDAVEVDLGKAGDLVFLNTSSTGLYVDMVRLRHRWEKRLGKWPAMLLALTRVLRHDRPRDLVVDGEPTRLWMLFAGNGRYLPVGFAPTHRPRLDDGLLDVRAIRADVPLARTRLVVGALTGTLRWCGAYRAWTAPTVTVRGGDSLGLSYDGEVVRVAGEVRLEKARRALTVYRPAGAVRFLR